MNFMILLLGIILLSFNLAVSQCPPSTTCTATWTTVEYEFDESNEVLEEDGFRASATFSFRTNCDGNFEFIIDDVIAKGNSNFLDEFHHLHYNYSSLTEKLVLKYFLTSDAFGDAGTSVPNYPSTIKRIFVYTASCGIWLRCSYKLPETIEKVCDDPWNGPAPDYPGGADRWVDHWRWHNCGEICCKKEYELSERSGFIEILSKTKSRYSDGEECSKQGDFWGNRPLPTDPSIELPCEDGC